MIEMRGRIRARQRGQGGEEGMGGGGSINCFHF
jgi:hypothetical protein